MAAVQCLKLSAPSTKKQKGDSPPQAFVMWCANSDGSWEARQLTEDDANEVAQFASATVDSLIAEDCAMLETLFAKDKAASALCNKCLKKENEP